MHSARRDFIVGVFVVIGLGAIAYLSLEVGGMSYTGPGGFRLVATFDEIGGLTSRAPVVISGVKVGQVTDIELDGDLRARVLLDVRDDLELSIDTSAAIRTSGLLGNQFIALEPGGEIDLLTSGESLDFTENALNLEKLIGAFVHGSAEGD
ncbi:MAG: outer membrane lipid asymmetry maintenance protein MlaD [bacterium]|nr:outer membrane lipid asymmetry maintenance protein MlaD [bacterium]